MCCGEVFYLSCDDVIAYGTAIAANFPALTLSFLIAISRVPPPPLPDQRTQTLTLVHSVLL